MIEQTKLPAAAVYYLKVNSASQNFSLLDTYQLLQLDLE